MASFTTPFFFTNHLAMKCNYYARIRYTVDVRGVFEESLVWSMILQPILHSEGRLAAL